MQDKTLIIFTHGIAEGPHVFHELMRLGQSLGCDTEAITLPGHGGSCREFACTDGRLWLEHLLLTIIKRSSTYCNIILVGHSLGSLLSIITAVDSDRIKGIILLNAPLSVRVKPRAVTTNLAIGLGLDIKPGDRAWAASQAISVGRGQVWEYVGWLPRIRDLFRYIKMAKQILPLLNVPILAIHSDRDELVSPKTVKLFNSLTHQSTCTILRLPNATHFTGPIEDMDAAKRAISEMIRNCMSQTTM